MRVEILGKERRRRWSDETKLKVVMSVDSVRQDGVISGVGPGRHDQAALGVI